MGDIDMYLRYYRSIWNEFETSLIIFNSILICISCNKHDWKKPRDSYYSILIKLSKATWSDVDQRRLLLGEICISATNSNFVRKRQRERYSNIDYPPCITCRRYWLERVIGTIKPFTVSLVRVSRSRLANHRTLRNQVLFWSTYSSELINCWLHIVSSSVAHGIHDSALNELHWHTHKEHNDDTWEGHLCTSTAPPIRYKFPVLTCWQM